MNRLRFSLALLCFAAFTTAQVRSDEPAKSNTETVTFNVKGMT